MNFKKVILGTVIAVSACGAAIASADVFANTFIHVKFAGQTTFQCVDSGLACASVSGGVPCKVYINSLSRTTPGYLTSTCAAVTQNSSQISTPYQGAVIDAD